MIKSTKLQYIDLKEGRMSTTNFMRNLRRDMPHLVTNVTSFKDAVRILNNKGILNENHDLPRSMWNNMDFDQRVDLLLKYLKDPSVAEDYSNKGLDQLPEWLYSNVSRELEGIESQGQMTQDNIDFEKEGGEYNDERDPEAEYFEKALRYQERGDDMDRDFEDGMYESLNEVKTKITAAQAHPQELAMGRKVEMEHTDNVEKAEKIALDHLSEDPFYYTKLHVAGLADELNRPKVKISTKKRTDLPTEVCKDNFTDKGNQMTVVKDIPKIKANANKAKKETNKGIGKITLMSLIAVKPRGVEKMAATGEKMKKIIVKENIDVNRFKKLVQNSSRKEIEDLLKDFISNPSKYNMSKEDMKNIVLSLKKKDRLEEDQTNIQNRADEINDFAKLVKSKDIATIIDQYESIQQYPAEWNITATEAMKILQKYFNDNDWDKFEELTSGGMGSEDDLDPAGGHGLDLHMEEADLNMLPDEQPNDVVNRVQEFIDSNPTLRQLSDNITLQNSGKDACVLKFDYWENLPKEALEKLELQFNVEREVDDGDDDKLPTVAYVLTPKPSVDKGMGLNKLDELIKKELKEYFDGRDNLTAGDDEDVNSDGNIMESSYSDEDLDKAARIIRSKMPRGESDISADVPGYKYGAYSFEPWEEVRDAMKAISKDPKVSMMTKGSTAYSELLDEISKFIDLLKTKKLIYLEW